MKGILPAAMSSLRREANISLHCYKREIAILRTSTLGADSSTPVTFTKGLVITGRIDCTLLIKQS